MRIFTIIFIMFFSSILLGNRFYKKAQINYSMVQMKEALNNLDDAINRVDNDKETLIKIYILKAKIYIGISKKEQAKKQYVKILFINNDYEMDENESPKILSYFNTVKSEFLESLTVKLDNPIISMTTVKSIDFKRNHPIQVEITNMSAARDAKIYYRQLGHLNYKKSDLTQTIEDDFEGYLPIPIEFPTQSFMVEYYVGVTDFAGNIIASSPDAKNPYTLKINVKKVDFSQDGKSISNDSVLNKWWFWAGVGVVVVGAGAGAYFITK